LDNDWILSKVRARCLRRVVACGVVAVVVALLVMEQRRYFENFFRGPYELGAAELDAIEDVSRAPRYFVKVAGSKALETGLEQITIHKSGGVETGRSVSAAYYVLVVGDKFLVCKSASGSRTTFEGELEPMPADLATRLFDDPNLQAVRERFYPYYLNDDSFRTTGYVALGTLLLLALLLGKVTLPAWKHLREPSSHPVVERAGNWGDPILLAHAQSEAGSPRHIGGNGWSATERFLIRSTFFTFDLLRLSDLLWAFKKVTKHSVNFIPTGKTYEAVLVCYGGSAMIKGNESATDKMLTYAAERAPWAIFGFSKELQAHFRRDQRSFCAAVEQRRREAAERARRA
jgi:hypothetical protein